MYIYCTYVVAVVAVAVFPDAVFSVEVLSKFLRKRKLGRVALSYSIPKDQTSYPEI